MAADPASFQGRFSGVLGIWRAFPERYYVEQPGAIIAIVFPGTQQGKP